MAVVFVRFASNFVETLKLYRQIVSYEKKRHDVTTSRRYGVRTSILGDFGPKNIPIVDFFNLVLQVVVVSLKAKINELNLAVSLLKKKPYKNRMRVLKCLHECVAQRNESYIS